MDVLVGVGVGEGVDVLVGVDVEILVGVMLEGGRGPSDRRVAVGTGVGVQEHWNAIGQFVADGSGRCGVGEDVVYR